MSLIVGSWDRLKCGSDSWTKQRIVLGWSDLGKVGQIGLNFFYFFCSPSPITLQKSWSENAKKSEFRGVESWILGGHPGPTMATPQPCTLFIMITCTNFGNSTVYIKPDRQPERKTGTQNNLGTSGQKLSFEFLPLPCKFMCKKFLFLSPLAFV